MKHVRLTRKFVSLLLTAVLLISLVPAGTLTARAEGSLAAVSVKGTVNASKLANNAEVVLSGDTTLVMDANKTLRSISGEYALTIQGSSKLTVTNADGTAIEVASLTASAPLDLSGQTAVYAKNGDITISGGVTAKATNKDFNCLVTGKGNISITGGKSDISAGANTILARGNVTLGGDVTVTSESFNAVNTRNDGKISITDGNVRLNAKNYGLYAANGIDMKAGRLISVGGITAELGDIELTGHVEATGGTDGYAIYARKGNVLVVGDLSASTAVAGRNCIVTGDGDIILKGGTIDVSALANALNSKYGVTIEGDATITSTDANAIRARGGNVKLSGIGFNLSAKELGIYALGWIRMDEGELHSVGSLYAENADITLSGTVDVTGTDGYAAIHAKQDAVSLSGEVNVTKPGADNPAIVAGSGDVSIESDTARVSAAGNAVVAESGAVTLGGDVEIISSEADSTAVRAEGGNLTVKDGSARLQGGKAAVFFKGSVNINSPKKILTPEGAWIGSGTINGSDNKAAHHVDIGTPMLSGTVEIVQKTPGPSTAVSFRLGGEVLDYSNNGYNIRSRWQGSTDDGASWFTIGDNATCTLAPQSAGWDVRVRISVTGVEGFLYSTPRKVVKQKCTKDPTVPELTISNGKVIVNNALITQEYFMLSNYRKEPASLSEYDWANAVSPSSSGALDLGGSEGNVYYVYTRVKENITTLASTDVVLESIYSGSSDYLQGIKLSATGVTHTLTRAGDYSGSYACYLNDVVRITATSIPANAQNFSGIHSSNWLLNYSSSDTGYGKFYEDEACTKTLQSGQYYKTVYLKLTKSANSIPVMAQFTKGYNDMATDSFSICVGDANGKLIPSDIRINKVMAKKGETVSSILYTVYPSKAAPVSGLTAKATTNSTGSKAPTISFSTGSSYVTVNASQAEPGLYFFDVYKDGVKLSNSNFTVEVFIPPLQDISLMQETLVVEPGKSYTLLPQLTPVDAEPELTWSSSNSSFTVNKGIVTVAASAAIAETGVITVTSGDLSASCEVRVAGEIFPLKVAGTTVTTRNMNDILGNGIFSFDGLKTLTVSGSYKTNARIIDNEGVEGLIIWAEKDGYLWNTSGVSVATATDMTITGPGKLMLTSSNDICLFVPKGTVTIRETSFFTNGKWGIVGPMYENSGKLIIDHAYVEVISQEGGIVDLDGGIQIFNSVISYPDGGEISESGTDIVDNRGVITSRVQIDPVKLLPSVRFTPDSDAVIGGTLTVDFEEMALLDEEMMEAIAEGTLEFAWYKNNQLIPKATSEDLELTDDFMDSVVYVVVSYKGYSIESERFVIYEKGLVNPFVDVAKGKFYYEPVLWAYYHDPQITKGTDDTHFSPNDTCTRGQVVTFLWRAQGCPEPTITKNPFKDVKSSAFYYKAVLWALENKITTGTSATTFSPNDPCTRGHVVTFLWRTNGEPAPASTSNPFNDVKKSAFYYNAVLWASGLGITTGTSSTTFSPGDPCTRGHVVTFLYRDQTR